MKSLITLIPCNIYITQYYIWLRFDFMVHGVVNRRIWRNYICPTIMLMEISLSNLSYRLCSCNYCKFEILIIRRILISVQSIITQVDGYLSLKDSGINCTTCSLVGQIFSTPSLKYRKWYGPSSILFICFKTDFLMVLWLFEGHFKLHLCYSVTRRDITRQCLWCDISVRQH